MASASKPTDTITDNPLDSIPSNVSYGLQKVTGQSGQTQIPYYDSATGLTYVYDGNGSLIEIRNADGSVQNISNSQIQISLVKNFMPDINTSYDTIVNGLKIAGIIK